jgi:hypothetical protein
MIPINQLDSGNGWSGLIIWILNDFLLQKIQTIDILRFQKMLARDWTVRTSPVIILPALFSFGSSIVYRLTHIYPHGPILVRS